MDINKINGYGQIFRLITPILITIILFVIAGLKDDIKQVRMDTKKGFEKSEIYFNNHLETHRRFDKEIFERLSRIEARIK